jgi:DnaK suppressor protein
MPGLSNAERAELQQELLALEAELRTQLAEGAEAAAPVELDQTRVGRLSRMDAMQMQAQQKAERERHQLQLSKVVVALQKFATQDYGYCQQCDEDIGYPRLKARPEASLCIRCQSANESLSAG